VVLVKQNLDSFARERSISLEESVDEFDTYRMAQLQSENGCRFLLLHYAGADNNTFDIWLPTDLPNYRQCLHEIVAELRVPAAAIVERKLSDNAFKRPTAV
jgi:hypothetical protein